MSVIPISGLHRYEKMAIEDAIKSMSKPNGTILSMVVGNEPLPRQILNWGG